MSKPLSVENLAIFGASPLFSSPVSTSNLVKPDFDRFLMYSKEFYSASRYTNNGPLVKLLESRLADFHGAEHCVAMCSGFWALVLVIKAIALSGRTEVLIPSLTYRRMDDIVSWAGFQPVYYDVDEQQLTASKLDIASNISDATALILGVHPIVNCCDVPGTLELGAEHGIPVVFDSVESVYEWCSEGKVGRFGEAEVFSLHASKLLNGFEGGYITTNNTKLADELALARSFGFQGPDRIVVADSMNAKMNEIHAAMALAALDEIDVQVEKNRERYSTYKRRLESLPGIRLVEFHESLPTSYKNIVVELLPEWPLSRNFTIQLLNAENILSRAYYSPPLHRKANKFDVCELPKTDELTERFILMPCGYFVSIDDIQIVIDFMSFLYRHGREVECASQCAGEIL